MILALICFSAFLASGLTLFSGFGLGTILMPVIAMFFPVPIAIAITAIVHLLNNLFKLVFLWRNVNILVLLGFGLPAFIAAIIGALLLDYISILEAITTYQLSEHNFTITPVKLAAGILLIIFSTAELVPFSNKLTTHNFSLSFGGALSGFFGGLSGHQGCIPQRIFNSSKT
ncbi:MAG: sulfite exporter TauE/SafE family protein [Rickettsiales bacterium]